MTRKMRLGTTNLTPTLAAMLCFAIAAVSGTAANAATTDTAGAQQPIEELVQLDEIQVRGKRLARAIEDAEDDFFALYNKLNRNSDYDVTCGNMSLNGSLILSRTCVPGFLASNMEQGPGYLGNSGVRCLGGSPDTVRWEPSTVDGPGQYYTVWDGCSGGPQVQVASAAVLAVHHRTSYAANVMRVVKSDPRLLEKASALAGLYTEMQQVQNRFVKVRKSR